MRRFASRPDLSTGVLLITTSVVAWIAGTDLRQGTSLQMGPGYFPRLLCILLAGIGLLLLIRGLLADRSAQQKVFPLRAIVLILAAIAHFALTIEKLGLAIAVLGVILIGGSAHREMRVFELAMVAVGMALLSVALFIYVLGLPISAWPWSR
jgi:putative tricarboxylic transport membrane protein